MRGVKRRKLGRPKGSKNKQSNGELIKTVMQVPALNKLKLDGPNIRIVPGLGGRPRVAVRVETWKKYDIVRDGDTVKLVPCN